MTVLTASFVDALVVLAIAVAAAAMLRSRSAAARHAVLASGIVMALVMPLLELLVPQIPISRLFEPATFVSSGLTFGDVIDVATPAQSAAVASNGVSWALVALWIWIAGTAVMCVSLVTGLVRLARLSAAFQPVDGRWRELTDELCREGGITRRVTLLQSASPSLLVTCGILRPKIILPAGASAWADDRVRVVLRHELAHITRCDAAIQIVGEALRVLHWMNPLVWIACSRLRQESEYACDDAVLTGGVEPTEYATHLLDVARSLSKRSPSWAAAPAIAESSTLERRVSAMLRKNPNRNALGTRGWAVAVLSALAVGIPLAAAGVAPTADRDLGRSDTGVPSLTRGLSAEATSARRERPGADGVTTFSGAVLDQFGGAIPGVQLTLAPVEGGQPLSGRTDASGRFAFEALAPGRYELVAALPAFKTVRTVVSMESAELHRTITLPLGTLQETITVACGSGVSSGLVTVFRIYDSLFPTLSAQAQPPSVVRVGGAVRPPRKTTHISPTCPASLDAETIVQVKGRIGVDGLMNDVRLDENAAPVRGDIGKSALDAVQQWKFTPTLLNGQPVDVEISVKLTFTR